MTDWENVEQWYHKIVGKEGHYYHQHVILPKLLPLLELTTHSTLLDLGCGQGILARHLPTIQRYEGVDLSPSLIQIAKKQVTNNQRFTVSDVCKPLPFTDSFTHVLFLLSLQNMEFAEQALKQAAAHLKPQGTLVLVLNHPCFRIPRHTGWGIDEARKWLYRRVDSYLSFLKIPIEMHPGKKGGEKTWSFHNPISHYSKWLHESGCAITLLEEWTSDKKSEGKQARMENRARLEFPLFLAIKAKKL